MFLNRMFFNLFLFGLLLNSLGLSHATEPFILSDLGRLKGISEALHGQKKPPLSNELKQKHNLLAHEVNGFIDGMEIYVLQGDYQEKSLEDIEEIITRINKEATLLQETSRAVIDKSRVSNNIDFKKLISWINPENIKKLVDWVTSDPQDDIKRSFVSKIKQRKWILIT